MKYIILGLILLATSACGQKKPSSGDHVYMSFSLDTVIVNSLADFLYLNAEIRQSSLSPDKKYLYNYNEREVSLEKINLDLLILEEKIKFEKDGPQGIGSFISNIQITERDRVLVWSVFNVGYHDLQGKLLKKIDFSEMAPIDNGISEEHLFTLVTLSDSPNILYGLSYKWDSFDYSFWKINLVEKQLRRFPLPAFEKIKDFRLELFSDGRIVQGYLPGIFLFVEKEEMFLTNEISNEIYIYDPKSDSLTLHIPENKLVPKEKKKNPNKKAESTEEMNRLIQNFKEDINFGKLVWDDENNVFYRFSFMEDFKSGMEENGVLHATSSKVFLTVLDLNLNILHEQEVHELSSTPKAHFVKDGKIWIFENIEDEMGFVRLSVEGI